MQHDEHQPYSVLLKVSVKAELHLTKSHLHRMMQSSELLTLMASTVALKTGLLCLTLLQNLGLAGLVKLQPYFSRILKALTSLLKDSTTWRRGKMNASS